MAIISPEPHPIRSNRDMAPLLGMTANTLNVLVRQLKPPPRYAHQQRGGIVRCSARWLRRSEAALTQCGTEFVQSPSIRTEPVGRAGDE